MDISTKKINEQHENIMTEKTNVDNQLLEELESLKFANKFAQDNLAEKDQEIENLKTQLAAKDNSLEVDTLNRRVAQLQEELEMAKSANTGLNDNEELVQARRKINELMLTNQQLREEMLESQKDIGEVMLTAKRQASKMVSDAEAQALAQVDKANQELFNIGNKAKGMSEEVRKSQEDVNQIFKEVIDRLSEMQLND